jgi:hypothetical protein
MRRILLALALLSFAGTLSAQDGDLTFRVFDISTIVAPRVPRTGPRLGSTPSHFAGVETEEEEARPFLEMDHLVDVIRSRVEPDSWDMDGADLHVRETRLYVRHRVHVIEKVKAFLATVSEAASRRVRFDVAVYRTAWASGIEPIAGRKFTPGDEAERLESGSVETYPGISTTFKITNRLRVIRDFDVEIAEGSVISDPIVETTDEGLVVDLVPHPSVDGARVVVEALIRRGEFERPIRRLKLSEQREDFLGTLDLPVFRQTYAATTAVVPSGESFTVPLVVDGSLLVFSVTPTVLGRGGAPWLMDIGVLAAGQKRYLVGNDEDYEAEYPGRMAPILMRVWDDYRPLASADEMAELIVTQVDPWYWDEEGDIEVAFENLLLLRAKEEVLSRVRRFVAAREAAALTSLRLDLEVASVAGPVETGVVTNAPETLAVYGGASVTTLAGKETCVLLGRTRNFVADYDVEVAQWSKIADPVIGQSFAGLAANLLPRLSVDGSKVRLDLGVLFATRKEEEVSSLDPGAEKLGYLEQVPENRRVFNTTIEMPRGALYVLDAGPDPKDPKRRLMIEVKVGN